MRMLQETGGIVCLPACFRRFPRPCLRPGCCWCYWRWWWRFALHLGRFTRMLTLRSLVSSLFGLLPLIPLRSHAVHAFLCPSTRVPHRCLIVLFFFLRFQRFRHNRDTSGLPATTRTTRSTPGTTGPCRRRWWKAWRLFACGPSKTSATCIEMYTCESCIPGNFALEFLTSVCAEVHRVMAKSPLLMV